MESSGAEEGCTNVSLLPLTKETLSDTFKSNIKIIKNRTGNRCWTWAQEVFGDVLDVKSMEEDVKPLAVSGYWQ